MTAYVIMDIEVTDPEGYKEYIKLAPDTVKLYGGKYIARGGRNETLEGDWQVKRLVILEFPPLPENCVIDTPRPRWSWSKACNCSMV